MKLKRVTDNVCFRGNHLGMDTYFLDKNNIIQGPWLFVFTHNEIKYIHLQYFKNNLIFGQQKLGAQQRFYEKIINLENEV